MKEHDHLEEKFYGRKERKAERKRASHTDRSKYKKTDRDQRLKQEEIPSTDHLIRGRVIAILPEEIVVDTGENLFSCTLKGRLKKERSRVKNLVVVGDFVFFEHEGGIVSVEKRKSLLSRKTSHKGMKEQIIASNIDMVLITAAALHPPLVPSVIDRYILAAQKGNMESLLVINKIDLDPDGEWKRVARIYSDLGLKVLPTSVEKGWGMEELQEVMKGKASLFAGESGVGKSSLINAVTGLELPTQEVAKKTQKGVHTTTGAKLIPLPCGGWCIDSPGIQSFGVWDLSKEEVLSYFSEIFEKGRECKYPDCTHSHEPGCKVIEAVEKGEISPLRYRSFRNLWEEVEK